MFYLLKGEKPTKKVVYEGIAEGLTVVYIATRTREIINAYNEAEECVASIYSTVSILAGADMETSKVQVAGDWEPIQYLAGLGTVPEVPFTFADMGFVVSTRKIPAGKVKGLIYEAQGESGGGIDFESHGTSIEDYLYEIVEMGKLAEDKGLDLAWAEKKDYRVLVSDAEIDEYLARLDKSDTIVGFDTETTGLLVNRTKLDKLVGISMSFEDNTGVYFPILHKRFENVHMGTDAFLGKLKVYIDRESPKAKKLVTHNGGFDWRVMKMFDIDLNIVFDTFIRFGLMAIGKAKYMGGLKAIASEWLGHDVVEMDEMYTHRTPSEVKSVKSAVLEKGLWVDDITRYKLERTEKFSDVQYDFRFASYEFSKLYGSADADFPRLIHAMMDEKWDSRMDFIYRMEIALIPVLGEQEYYGVRTNGDGIQVLHEATAKELVKLEADIYKEAGKEFNINSPKQKAEILFDEMGCPFLPRFRTKSGGRSTNKRTMDTLNGYKNKDGSPQYPIVALLAEYTKKNTLVTNFYKKLPLLMHEGYLFPSYKQLGTETGRISCFAPNLQQTEGTSRFHMVPDSDDYYFLIADYSQVEYRIMAGLSGEEKVLDFFIKNPEADYHILSFANMMGKAYEDVTPQERNTGKTLNFGTTYGLEDENLALNLYGDTTAFHQMMARQTRDKYFDGIPTLRDYFESVRDEAEQRGYAETFFGRRRDIPEFNSGRVLNDYTRGSGRRKAGNHPVQGSAADIQKMAMIRIRNAFRSRGYFENRVRLVKNVHDEVVIQVHKSLNSWYVLSIMRTAMEMDMSEDGFPPLYIGANVGYSWGDGQRDELEAPVLLMNKKIAEMEEKLARGEELEQQVDQREEWLQDIRYFAVEQVKQEIEEGGFTTVEEAHSSGRLVKYSRTFKNSDMLVNELLTKSVDDVWVRLAEIETSEKFEWAPTAKVVEEGEELVDETAMLADTVKDLMRYSRERNTLRVKLLEPDGGFFSAFDKMLVASSSMSQFKDNQQYIKVEVQVGESEVETVRQRGLISGMVGLLRDYLTIHVTGGSYGFYEEQIEELGTTLMK